MTFGKTFKWLWSALGRFSGRFNAFHRKRHKAGLPHSYLSIPSGSLIVLSVCFCVLSNILANTCTHRSFPHCFFKFLSAPSAAYLQAAFLTCLCSYATPPSPHTPVAPNRTFVSAHERKPEYAMQKSASSSETFHR